MITDYEPQKKIDQNILPLLLKFLLCTSTAGAGIPRLVYCPGNGLNNREIERLFPARTETLFLHSIQIVSTAHASSYALSIEPPSHYTDDHLRPSTDAIKNPWNLASKSPTRIRGVTLVPA